MCAPILMNIRVLRSLLFSREGHIVVVDFEIAQDPRAFMVNVCGVMMGLHNGPEEKKIQKQTLVGSKKLEL